MIRTPLRPAPAALAAVAVGALVAAATPLLLAPASANTAGTGLVISEVYLNGGSAGATYANKFVELYNPTSAAIDLAGLSIQYRSPTGTAGASTTTALTGSVPAAGYFVLVGASNGANGVAVPNGNQSAATFSPGGAGGTVWLANATTAQTLPTGSVTANSAVIDLVGYGTSNTYEGAVAPAASVTSSIQRNATNVDTDSNNPDFTAKAQTPGAASGPSGPTALAATNPGNKTGSVGTAIAPITLTASGGTSPYTFDVTGLPAGLSATTAGVISGTPTTVETKTVNVTVTDSATPTPATATTSFTFTISAAGTTTWTPIADIQGTGATTPLANQTVTTRGVVTASYPTGGLNGFYIQTPGPDTTPDASDGIFVYIGAGTLTYPAVGDSVEVTGTAAEFSGQTQIAVTAITPIAAMGAVVPKTTVPGTECGLPGTACPDAATMDAAREAMESEAIQPTQPWTATDVYDGSPYYQGVANSSAFRGEIGVAANSSVPLVAPTEVIDAQDTAGVAARTAYNNAHRIILDDGSSWTYSTTVHQNDPFPWFTLNHTVRVGAAITFPKPVVFTYGFNSWRILPESQVVGNPGGKITIAQDRPAAPENVGGDVKLATFNVLNFFPTTGEEFVNSGLGTCTYYFDKDGNRITNNTCTPEGPRGAANAANLKRQRDKIVAAINKLDADVVSLEELENSVKYNKSRDFAIGELVNALNAAAGAGTWAYVPSPAVLPTLAEQDVIRNGFIYRPAKIALVGESVVLSNESGTGGNFQDAREPLAQAFKQVGTPDSQAFGVIVNHFKSKGSGTPDPDGQGNANDRRKLQATSLVSFADAFKAQRGITRMFLTGDFNAYSQEDPIQILEQAGYVNLESTTTPGEKSYNFDGMVGSLDHVLANAAAKADVTGVDIWTINGNESVYYEYSRYNYNTTSLYDAGPYRSSDHSPEIVGIRTTTTPPTTPTTPTSPPTTPTTPTTPPTTGTKVASALTVTAQPAKLRVLADTTTLSVSVTAAGVVPTGTVAAFLDGKQVSNSAQLTAGKATLVAGPFDPVGMKTLDVRYVGDSFVLPSNGNVTVEVVKQKPRVKVKVKPAKRPLRTAVKYAAKVKISAKGYTPTGKVTVKLGKKKFSATVKNGVAKIRIGKFTKPGTYKFVLRYRGDSRTMTKTVKLRLKVVR